MGDDDNSYSEIEKKFGNRLEKEMSQSKEQPKENAQEENTKAVTETLTHVDEQLTSSVEQRAENIKKQDDILDEEKKAAKEEKNFFQKLNDNKGAIATATAGAVGAVGGAAINTAANVGGTSVKLFQQNWLIIIAILNSIIDWILRSNSTFNSRASITVDTVFMAVILIMFLKVGWRFTIPTCIIFFIFSNYLLSEFVQLLNTTTYSGFVISLITRVATFAVPVLFAIFFNKLVTKDQELIKKESIVLFLILVFAWEVGINEIIYELLVVTLPAKGVEFLRNEGVLSIIETMLFTILNGWLLLSILVQESSQESKGFVKFLQGSYVWFFVIVLVLLIPPNFDHLDDFWTTNDVLISENQQEESAKRFGTEILDSLGTIKDTILCKTFPDTSDIGFGPDAKAACARLEEKEKEDEKIRESANVDVSRRKTTSIQMTKSSKKEEFSFTDNIQSTFTLRSETAEPDEETEYLVSCYINNEENKLLIDGRNEEIIVETIGGEVSESHTCEMPNDIKEDSTKAFAFFNEAQNFDMIVSTKFDNLVTSTLELIFEPNEINMGDHGMVNMNTNKFRAESESSEKSAKLSLSIVQDLPLLVTADSDVFLELTLSNEDSGKISELKSLVIVLPESITIDSDEFELQEKFDEKTNKEINKFMKTEYVTYMSYTMNSEEALNKSNKYIENNEEFVKNIPLIISDDLIFDGSNFETNKFVVGVVEFEYKMESKKEMALSDELYDQLRLNNLPGDKPPADYEVTYISNTGFEDVALVELEPTIKATLDVIADAEGTKGEYGYSLIYGGQYFKNFDQHPQIYKSGPEGKTSAAGRYQIVYKTWSTSLLKRLESSDFTPKNQDRAAVELLKIRGAYEDALAGDLDAVIPKLRDEWVSLPGARHQTRTWTESKNVFATRLKYYIEGETGGEIVT